MFMVVLTGPAIQENALRALWMILGSAVLVVPFTFLAYIKTEGGWRWRNGQD